MSKKLKKAIRSFFLWIGKHLLEAASFFEVKEEVKVHTAQITAGEEPAPKEEVDSPPKAKAKVKAKAKTRTKAKKRRGAIPPTQYGHFYALRKVMKVTLAEAEEISGLKQNTFSPDFSRRPKGVIKKFIIWFETTQTENPKDPLLNHEKVQAHYLMVNGKLLQGKVSKAKRVQEINASLEFPKEAKGEGETLKRVKPENLDLGLLSLLSSKQSPEYRRPSLTQKSAAIILDMTSHHYLKNNPKEVVEEAREAAEDWVENYPINVGKAWKKVEKISSSMAKKDVTSLRKVCGKEKLNMTVFQVFWALDIVFKDESFRDMFPTLHNKRQKTVLHKDLS